MRHHPFGESSSVAALAIALLAGLVMLLGTSAPAAAQEEQLTEEERVKIRAQANNPLASMNALNFQNFYSSALYGLPDRTANTFYIRAAVPIGRTLTRASLPLATRPSGPTEAESGLGDFNIFTAYLFVSDATTSLGVGPLLVAPTATDDALGQGKWQAGVAAIAFKATPKVQVGGLVTWQGSFAGDEDRESTSLMAVQPFAVWQLGGGTYLRSTGIWGFDLKSGDYAVPIGFGIGQVLGQGRVIYNIFFEPQFTILHDGVGQPKVQLFAGLNLQFRKK